MTTRRELLASFLATPLTAGVCKTDLPVPPCRTPDISGSLGSGGPAWLDSILAPRLVNQGDYAGNYFSQDPTSAHDEYVSFYFSCVSLRQFARRGDKRQAVLACLDGCLRSARDSGFIRDIDSRGMPRSTDPDSTDAYTGVFLSLACEYAARWNQYQWWDANYPAIKNLAMLNIFNATKGNGLVEARRAGTREPRAVGLLMDVCQVYRGLADVAGLLTLRGHPDAAEFSDRSARLGAAIHSKLFSNSETYPNRWLWNDDPGVGSPEAYPGDAFYPWATCQIYPEFYGVRSGTPGDDARFDAGARYLDNAFRWHLLEWQLDCPNENRFPWLVLGLWAAVNRGQLQRARVMLGKSRIECRVMNMEEVGYARGILAANGY